MVAAIVLFPYTGSLQRFVLPQIGEASKETVIAPYTFDVLKSAEELERERKMAVEKVLMVLEYDAIRSRQMFSSLRLFRQKMSLLGGKQLNDPSARDLRQELSRILSENALKILLKTPVLMDRIVYAADSLIDRGILAMPIVSSKERLYELRLKYNTSFNNHHIYTKQYVYLLRDSADYMVDVADLRVREVAFEGVIQRLRHERRFDGDALNAAYEFLSAYVHPNISIAEGVTAERRKKAAADVLAISGKVLKDTEIVHKHQEVTPAILQKLKSLHIAMEKMENVRERRKMWTGNLGRIIFVFIAFLFLSAYIVKYQPFILKNPKHLVALVVVLMFQLLIIRLSLMLMPRLFEGPGTEMLFLQPACFVPTAAGAALAAILFGRELCFVLMTFVALYFGIALNFNNFLFLFALFGGLTAALFARDIRYRWEYFKVIPPVLLVQIVCIAMWHLINYQLTMPGFFQNCGLAVINTVLSLFFAMAVTPLLEYLFDVTTNMTLIELSDMNHPVLKRLSIEAAGTYNHSVLVGNLAESAAERIGANPLLARVASYYHDIGKIDKADYFVENAIGSEKSRHNKLTPNMSALIILSHVKEGLDLAREYRLPQVLQEVIAQHHGTSWVSFFYEKALEQDPHKQVQERDFHYPGPPPQSREAAIIMLADSVEAASRSLGTSSPKLLRELVKKIIRSKFMDGQLDQCNLTLRDLDGIVEGFMPVLQGMFHSRIKYPSQ
ncbi:MAG: HDIG domain-containing protein [Chitinispirillaceae bacterium]|nr:HDIG domain-containing protein [Chitinispirillaceae bacterium]